MLCKNRSAVGSQFKLGNGNSSSVIASFRFSIFLAIFVGLIQS